MGLPEDFKANLAIDEFCLFDFLCSAQKEVLTRLQKQSDWKLKNTGTIRSHIMFPFWELSLSLHGESNREKNIKVFLGQTQRLRTTA